MALSSLDCSNIPVTLSLHCFLPLARPSSFALSATFSSSGRVGVDRGDGNADLLESSWPDFDPVESRLETLWIFWSQ